MTTQAMRLIKHVGDLYNAQYVASVVLDKINEGFRITIVFAYEGSAIARSIWHQYHDPNEAKADMVALEDWLSGKWAYGPVFEFPQHI